MNQCKLEVVKQEMARVNIDIVGISSSLSVISVIYSVHLRLLILLPAILIPACASSSPEFHMIYSAYKLYKQGGNIQPRCIPFPVWDQSVELGSYSLTGIFAHSLFLRLSYCIQMNFRKLQHSTVFDLSEINIV